MAAACTTRALGLRPAPAQLSSTRRPASRAARSTVQRVSSRDAATNASDSRSMLEAFFVGRALAEVLNERLGAALGDALADFGRWDAETRQAIREFQEEVTSRARREMLASAGAGDASGSGSSTADLGSAAPPDLPALVDDLRAEVAATRAVVQQLRLKQQQEQGGGRR